VTSQVEDKFENGIFWELYKDLERQFQTFLEYVPYLEGNEKTYSFKLLNLILSIGGHVDSAFKEMVRFRGLPKDPKISEIRQKLQRAEIARASGNRPGRADFTSMWELFEVFEKIYTLSEKTIIYKILPDRDTHKPFEAIKNDPNSGWWNIYNGLKHDVSFTLKDANLKNTWDALASAFLLNVIHEPAILRLNKYGMLKSKYGDTFLQKTLEVMLMKKQKIWGILETPLFIYDYEQ